MDGTLMAVLTAAAGGAAGEAGKTALSALGTLVRRLRGSGSAAEVAVRDLLADPEPARARATASVLAAEMAADPAFDTELRAWAVRSGLLEPTVRNTVSGGATITGPVIQARDIHGGVHLGGQASPD
jgi:hypothetical protein